GIVPASSVAYECLAVGMYLVVGYYADNQKAIYTGLCNSYATSELKSITNITKEKYLSIIKNIIDNTNGNINRIKAMPNKIISSILWL
ncbi:MAG: hypothetical protein NZ519_13935, partial [Bacteroidia bacterium]|nr:hypothetical protein [Bacteroidia bacterium]